MQENEEMLHALENHQARNIVEIQEGRHGNQVQEPLVAANVVQEQLQPVNAVQGLLPPDRQNLIDNAANLNGDLDLTPTVVRMIARFQAHASTTGTMMTNFLEETEDLLIQIQNNLRAQVNTLLVPGQSFRRLEVFASANECPAKYCRMIESRGIPLGKRLDSVYDKATSSYVPDLVTESFQYVSAIEILELVLSSPEVREAIESGEPSEAGMYGSFLDGIHYAQHPFLQIYRRALRLKIYVDDLEIVGPLGSKTGVHILMVFYLQMDNLPSQMNSGLSSIHVLLICCSEDVKKYGYSRILAPFLDDLKKLESDEGVQILIDDEISVLRATVIALCGDGLAIHEVYALLSPSSNKFCRMCMYLREDLHNASSERAPERTEDLFNQHYDLLRQSNFSQEVKTLTGVNGESSFTSRFFHRSRNKIFDLMHEFLEGICPMTIKAVLHQYVIIEKRLNIQEMNDRI
ncbi:hypothetical protein QAD02_012689 [Eretmocerus hayati]|uniref:Uncharacterized protein n=1 Tax=Eretmocerus hayati TaxID=131215 RepID=A0ACC2P397_9HYME|nr:hypothetical protein QAD02_012689 [Eretmocerus hayati]